MLHLVKSQQTYSSSEVAELLGIAPSTLRKYNLCFSKVGISFTKEKGRLVYKEHDIKLFQELIRLHEKGGTTLQNCVAKVAQQSQLVSVVSEPVVEVSQQDTNEAKLLEQMEQRLQQMQQYIDTKLADRDKQLMGVIKELQEIKAAQRKKKWWQFWR
nr:DUF3967 domain-containing protein [Priestia flexa]WEZ10435.1 MerR family transcriptional regulator [Priestia flexa]